MKKSTDRILNIILTLAVAALFSFAAASGVLSAPDGTVSDRFYQEQSAGQADIAIVGIDDRAFQELGPWPWSRNIMAEAVRTLNSGGPDLRPAAIGIDVLFVGPGPDPAGQANRPAQQCTGRFLHAGEVSPGYANSGSRTSLFSVRKRSARIRGKLSGRLSG